MDSITQATLGALCGEVTLRKQLGWKGVAWGFLFGTLPDLDIIIYPWLEPVEKLSWHRGLSHSLLICVTAALFFGWLLARLHRKKGVTFKRAAWFVWVTWLTHILIDCFTTYGTQIYEPFSSYRFAWNNMSIIDLSFTLPMLLAVVVALFFKKDSLKRTMLGRAAVAWICFYALASFTMKYKANQHFEKQLAARGIVPVRMVSAPTLSNIFLWRMLAESDGQYHIAYWSVFDDAARPPSMTSTPKGHDSLEPFLHYPETEKLIWFAKSWHKVVQDPKNPGSVLFIDMRFTEMVTAESKKPVFVWSLMVDSGEFKFRQVSFRDEANIADTLRYLGQRIQGKAPEWMEAPWPWEKPSS